MRLDRVAEDIYIFVSELYAQVTATVLVAPDGAIVVDTMPFPSETREILSFIEGRLGAGSVRYVINTHHHGDHVYGNYLFEGAEVIAHDRCREMLARLGPDGLARAKRDTPALAEVELRLPDITFQNQMHIGLGYWHLRVFHTPGNTPDGASVFVENDRVLIAGDALMPVPHIVGGNCQELAQTLSRLKSLRPSHIVQGHGPILLRGEVDETIDKSVSYLSTIVDRVREVVRRGDPPEELRGIDIETCGMSRIPLDGLVARLHLNNLVALYEAFSQS